MSQLSRSERIRRYLAQNYSPARIATLVDLPLEEVARIAGVGFAFKHILMPQRCPSCRALVDQLPCVRCTIFAGASDKQKRKLGV